MPPLSLSVTRHTPLPVLARAPVWASTTTYTTKSRGPEVSQQQDPTCLPYVGVPRRIRRHPRLLVRLIVAAVVLGYAPALILLGASAEVVIAVVPFAVSLIARMALGSTAAAGQLVRRPRIAG